MLLKNKVLKNETKIFYFFTKQNQKLQKYRVNQIEQFSSKISFHLD